MDGPLGSLAQRWLNDHGATLWKRWPQPGGPGPLKGVPGQATQPAGNVDLQATPGHPRPPPSGHLASKGGLNLAQGGLGVAACNDYGAMSNCSLCVSRIRHITDDVVRGDRASAAQVAGFDP